MGWLIALTVLVLLAVLPVGVSAVYNFSGPTVFLIVGSVRLRMYPKKKKAVSSQTNQEKSDKTKQEKTGGSYKDFLPLVQLVLDFLGDLRRKLLIERLEMRLIMAGDDPSDLAVNYGRAWAALGNIIPQIERVFVIKKRDLEVECDFTTSETVVYVRADVTIRVIQILSLTIGHGLHLLKEYNKIMNQRKGGAKE